MNNFRVLLVVLWIPNFACNQVSIRCNEENEGKVICIKNYDFNGGQFVMCDSLIFYTSTFHHKLYCNENGPSSYPKYCWIPCMAYTNHRMNGLIYSTCRCNEDFDSHQLDRICSYPKVWKACEWLGSCLSNDTVHTIFRKFTIYRFYCEGVEKDNVSLEVFLGKLLVCINFRLIACLYDRTMCETMNRDLVLFECLFIRNTHGGNDDLVCDSRADKDQIFQLLMLPVLPTYDQISQTPVAKRRINCMLDDSNSVRLIRIFFGDKHSFSTTADKILKKTVTKLQLSNDILWRVFNIAKEPSSWMDVFVYDKEYRNLNLDFMFKIEHFPINIHNFYIYRIAPCKNAECKELGNVIGEGDVSRHLYISKLVLFAINGSKILVDFHQAVNPPLLTPDNISFERLLENSRDCSNLSSKFVYPMICTDDELKDIVNFRLTKVDENTSYDCVPGSVGGQCVALVKCQCRVPKTDKWIPGRLVKDSCNSIAKGTVIATFKASSRKYGNEWSDHTGIFHSCNSTHIKLYGQACGRKIQLEIQKHTYFLSMYEVTIDVKAKKYRPANQVQKCKRHYDKEKKKKEE